MVAAQSTGKLYKWFPMELGKCFKLVLEGDERNELVTVAAWGREYVEVKVSQPAAFLMDH